MYRYTVTFAETTATRTSDAEYTHAACRRDAVFGGWKITFHKSHAAAKRAAGRYGAVRPVEKA